MLKVIQDDALAAAEHYVLGIHFACSAEIAITRMASHFGLILIRIRCKFVYQSLSLLFLLLLAVRA